MLVLLGEALTEQDEVRQPARQEALERLLAARAEALRPEELPALLARLDAVVEYVQRLPLLRPHAARVRLMLRLLHDVRTGRYRALPWRSAAAIASTLLYVLNPFDLVPDALPVLGQLDDLLALRLLWGAVSEDLRAYAAWRRTRASNEAFEALTVAAFGSFDD